MQLDRPRLGTRPCASERVCLLSVNGAVVIRPICQKRTDFVLKGMTWEPMRELWRRERRRERETEGGSADDDKAETAEEGEFHSTRKGEREKET